MKNKPDPKSSTTLILDSAFSLAKRIGADVILVLASGRINKEWLEKTTNFCKLVLVFQSKKLFKSYGKAGYHVILSPPHQLARFSRIRHALISAMSRKLIKKDEKVVCLTGPVTSNILDSITIIKMKKPFKEIALFGSKKVYKDFNLDVLEAVLDIAVEIGTWGREGKPVGTIFVIGDTANVLKFSKQITFNPFKGYDDKQKNITDPSVKESIKEFAQIDGAFVIKCDGTVTAGGRLLLMPREEIEILKGYGTRHNAAAFISKKTEALAVVVSETTGGVTVFKDGKILFALNPQEMYGYQKRI